MFLWFFCYFSIFLLDNLLADLMSISSSAHTDLFSCVRQCCWKQLKVTVTQAHASFNCRDTRVEPKNEKYGNDSLHTIYPSGRFVGSKYRWISHIVDLSTADVHKLTFLKASECSGHSGTNRYSVFMFNQTLKNTFYYCKSHICWKAPESSVQLLPEGVLVSRNLAKVSMIHSWYGKCDEMRLPGFELQELY